MEIPDQLRTCGPPPQRAAATPAPELPEVPPYAHLWTTDEAVTSVAVWHHKLYAGTISGHIHCYDLDTYQHVQQFQAHTGSILCLVTCNGRLFSGSSDSLIKVWTTDDDMVLENTIYCLVDVGDIFCLSFIEESRTVYFGTQNASIHWVKLPDESNSIKVNAAKHPAVRPNRFFDSAGPGGKLAPPQKATIELQSTGLIHSDATFLEVPIENAITFAHNSYVYCMQTSTIGGKLCLVTGSGEGTIKIWSIHGDGHLKEAKKIVNNDAVLCMALAADWQLYCGLESGHVLVVDLETWQVLRYSVADDEPLLALAAVGDGIFAMSSTGKVFNYDPSTASVSSWPAGGYATACATLDYKENIVVTTTNEGTITLWDVSKYLGSGYDNDGLWRGSRTLGLSNDNMIDTLSRLIRYQTVSSREGQYWADCRRCASSLRDLMRGMGAEAELWRVEKGNPVVHATFKANKTDPKGRRPARVLFYGHYDVIEASENWNTPAFALTAVDGYLYGRGVSDNKGPCIAAIYAAAELYAKQELTNDLIFLIEGEEECGSFGFYNVVEEHRARLGHIDWIVFSNSYWLNDTRPCLNYGLRGVVLACIKLKSDKADVHSGVDGGVFREPAQDMIHLLSTLTKVDGSIAIPEFADQVMPVSAEEDERLDEIVAIPGIAQTKADLLHKWYSPSLTVHKFTVSGPGNQTVIPSTVTAFISLRLVPNQTADEAKQQLQEFLAKAFKKQNSPNTLDVEFRYDADPWLGDSHNEVYQILEQALYEQWESKPLFVREGGSIPMARALEKLFDAPAAQLPCGQSSDGAHLDNERLRITNLLVARNVFVKLFSELSPRNASSA